MKFKGLAIAFLAFIFSSPLFAKNITNGVINFSMMETGKRYIPLNGDWEFYENQTFTSLLGAQLKVDFIDAPDSWTQKREDKPQLPSMGCNTYRIMITGLRPNFEYAIFSRRSPNYSAMIYANGRFAAEYGKFSRHKNNYKAAQTPVYCRMLSSEEGYIELVIQVSNWTGSRGGIESPIFFGEDKVISRLFTRILLTTAAIMGALLFVFLMNTFFWFFDKQKRTNLYFMVMLFFLLIRFGFNNFNIYGLLGLFPPFGIQYKLQNIAIFSGVLFLLLFKDDKVFSSKHPLFDKTLATLSFALLIVFICLPESVSMIVLNASFFWAGIISVYALFRFVYDLRKGQITTAVFAFFYMIIAIPITIDHIMISPWTDSHVYFSEIFTIIMVIFDIVYMAAILEILQKKSINVKATFSKYHFAIRRFIPRNLPSLMDTPILKTLDLGDSTEDSVILMFVGFAVISPDNTQISLRDNFESRGFYSATIVDQIIQNDGAVISITNQGISAIFKKNEPHAMEAAYKIRNLLQTINARRAEDYYPCVTFNIAVHQSDVLLGVVGDRSRIELSMISSGIEVIDKMCNLGFAMNIPILISEPTIKALGDSNIQKTTLLGKIHFSEFTKPIGLYGLISSEEEENSLESLEETPFITQIQADKYINF